jgi:hypothetical protein
MRIAEWNQEYLECGLRNEISNNSNAECGMRIAQWDENAG